MKYFLKKTMLKKGEYLQIYQSEYTREKGSRNKSYKALGYVEELKAKGSKDPVAEAKAEVKRLNAALIEQENEVKARKVGSVSPVKNAGYFTLKGIANSLPDFEKSVKALSETRDFRYDVYQTMMALVYARAVKPSSKKKTHSDVFPSLFEKTDSNTYSQVLSCCEYIGGEYKKLTKLLTYAVARTYGLEYSNTYFDCTNFYFEIDREDDLRLKGPSKENRHDPIVGMALLLDANQIPVSMTMYPGNESEKPYLRKTLNEMKKENSIAGRTIQVADKGLNCAANIHSALKNGDGYLFSKSLKGLAKEELDWLLDRKDEEFETFYEKDSSGRKHVKYKAFTFIDNFKYSYKNEDGSSESFTARERRLLTFSPSLRVKKHLEINRLVNKAKKLCNYALRKEEFGECSKYVSISSEGKKVKVELNKETIERDKKLAGYNLLVTSEVNMTPGAIYATYHNLWRIEQSFRLMKHYLDARPVYLSSLNSIKGHFLLCYISVVLERIFEFKVLGGRFSHEEIMDFIRNFNIVKLNSKDYLNTLTDKDDVGAFLASTILPEVTNLLISPAQVSKLMKAKLNFPIAEL